jgi:hypothetical protein|tara:strand:- start:23 stop:400 length:378 start_codon:yes stop_codon:yes gene_type:complete
MKINKSRLRRMIKEGLNEMAGSSVNLGMIMDPDNIFFSLSEDTQVGLLNMGDLMEAAASRAFQQDSAGMGRDMGSDKAGNPTLLSFYKMALRRKEEMNAVRDFLDIVEFTNQDLTLVEFLQMKGL